MRTKTTSTPTPSHHHPRPLTSPENHTHSLTPPSTPHMQSPTQPPPLSEDETDRLRNVLDNGAAFQIITRPLSKKRKRGSDSFSTEDQMLDSRLNVQYQIKPAIWHRIKRYKKFSMSSESIPVNECVLVKHDDSLEPSPDENGELQVDVASQWKAKVLEIRALDPEHVYLRVAWMNRPEDLPEGRQPHHGTNELIPTNQLDIIDAMAVNGSIQVMWWKERDDKAEMPGKDEFFWRQTYDLVNTTNPSEAFSKLRHLCIDDAPQNPDEMIIQCKNPACEKWLHVTCIAEDALDRALQDMDGDEIQAKVKRKSIAGSGKKRGKNTPGDDQAGTLIAPVVTLRKHRVRVQVFVKNDISSQLVSGNITLDKGAEKTEIVITDESGERREPVRCLFEDCGAAID
ncbi:hypothetical protein Tdes44962_MAKER09964 [Teratosphaeria destructans]|uniref:BAH domain-containing protein n=1 Tax=Teratosphaeria destructans TaxID=418781 RepID=A0A9W7SR06_9PEZI|nr:hypothetical protein Tdes44962_MAKER09964 [Teratosphaeria destructans]